MSSNSCSWALDLAAEKLLNMETSAIQSTGWYARISGFWYNMTAGLRSSPSTNATSSSQIGANGRNIASSVCRSPATVKAGNKDSRRKVQYTAKHVDYYNLISDYGADDSGAQPGRETLHRRLKTNQKLVIGEDDSLVPVEVGSQ